MGIIDNSFNNRGDGEQNIGQGDGAIGKQENIRQDVTGNSHVVLGTGDAYVEQHYHDAPPPVIPKQLPPLNACFLGRDRELAELAEQLQPGKVAAVCGPGGMGKSALAAQAVSRLEEDHFPDGIVFYSFYGHPQTEQALQAICVAFQVKAKTGLESTVRQVLSGKKALLVLDGTEEADDLKAVLDLRSTCGVLITSRKRDDAQSFRLDLTPLEDEPAVEVLREHSGLVGDDYAVQGICKLLDGWPVGLRIAGRYLGTTGESAADYLRWLKKRPFRKLRTGEHQEDNAALLLERSVEQVSADAVQTLRLAGVLAFAPITLMPFALALFKEDEDTDELELRSNDALGELVRYGLLETSKKGWQTSHTLIHTYARTELALSREKLERLAGAYIQACQAASRAGLPGYAFLDRERAHCLRLIESCLESELWREVKELAWAIWEYLHRQGHWTEQQVACEMTLTAARQTGDMRTEGWSLNGLGLTCKRRRELDKALSWYEKSLSIWRELIDKHEEGTLLDNIAGVYGYQGKHELALEQYQQSLSIRQEIGDREGEGTTLGNIGYLYHADGNYEIALHYYEQSLPIKQEVGDKIGEGTALNNIAEIYKTHDNPAKALKYHEQALAMRRELGYRDGEADSCWNIGFTYGDMGDLAQAEVYISKAVKIAEDISHPALEQFRDGLAQVRAERRGA